MRLTLIASIFAVIGGAIGLIGSPPAHNTDAAGVLLKGYDPVAYFEQKEPRRGDPAMAAEHNGVRLLFSSPEHRTLFLSDPDRFMPAYGGYCALGVALGERLDIDPTAWHMQDGQLHLFLDHGTREVWLMDGEHNKDAADRLWQEHRAGAASAE